LDNVIERLRQVLPPRIEDLGRPFAVGVVSQGEHLLIDEGPLPEAVAASCAAFSCSMAARSTSVAPAISSAKSSGRP
jgi:hypothetical protein